MFVGWVRSMGVGQCGSVCVGERDVFAAVTIYITDLCEWLFSKSSIFVYDILSSV